VIYFERIKFGTLAQGIVEMGVLDTARHNPQRDDYHSKPFSFSQLRATFLQTKNNENNC
jgi:hypothetical protein